MAVFIRAYLLFASFRLSALRVSVVGFASSSQCCSADACRRDSV